MERDFYYFKKKGVFINVLFWEKVLEIIKVSVFYFWMSLLKFRFLGIFKVLILFLWIGVQKIEFLVSFLCNFSYQLGVGIMSLFILNLLFY